MKKEDGINPEPLHIMPYEEMVRNLSSRELLRELNKAQESVFAIQSEIERRMNYNPRIFASPNCDCKKEEDNEDQKTFTSMWRDNDKDK